MNKIQYSIKERKKEHIRKTASVLIDEDNPKTILDFLENIIMLDYYPDEVKALTKKWILDENSLNQTVFQKGNSNKVESRKNALKRKLHFICKHINEYKCYKFFFMGGGTCSTEGIYAITHQEAWEKVNDKIINEYGSIVRCTFCISIDGEDMGTLSNLESMFKPKEAGQINSVRADDLSTNWKKEKKK